MLTDPVELYKSGLHKESEAVISAHFMHNINMDLGLKLYSANEFSKKSLAFSHALIIQRLLPILIEASDQFIVKRAAAAKNRIQKHFKEYGLNTAEEAGFIETIAEVMFDRHFLKGCKNNVPRQALANKVKRIIEKNQPIKLVIPALPFKSSSPLKTRGDMPDLAEINFLLSLVEIAKTITLIRNEKKTALNKDMAKFTIISDGSRFNHFLNEPDKAVRSYQDQLRWWVDTLGISDYIEIVDYQSLIATHLPQHLYLEKNAIRERVFQLYKKLMMPLLNPYDMRQTINLAIQLDPDFESSNAEGRFIPLFKSLIYSIKYSALLNYTDLHEETYTDLYTELTRHIFEPYTPLTMDDAKQVEHFIAQPQQKKQVNRIQILEYLRQAMLREVWIATIHYIAEIRSDRDLPSDPIVTCLPDHIRWTIHAKPGQLAILTTTANGDPIQAWHGVGVLKLTKKNKLKLYTLPTLLLEGRHATPVTIVDLEQRFQLKDQAFFYIDPVIHFETIDDLLLQIQRHLTRNRKS